MSDGGSKIAYRNTMDENYELAVVTETSGAAISVAEQKNSRKGKTSNPCYYDQSSRGPVLFSPLDENAGYTGGITNEPTEGTTGMCAAAMAPTHFLHLLVVKEPGSARYSVISPLKLMPKR